jgi:choline dehydrogenase-like flavoprotein
MKTKKLDADIVLAGGGPGGCEIARHFAKKGKKVILVERGANSDAMLGWPVPLGTFWRLESKVRIGLPVQTTIEGDPLNMCKGVGGGTMIYCASAFRPNLPYWKNYGIEFPQDLLDEADRDTRVTEPPEEFIGPGTRRIWEAANELGYPWTKQLRHVDFSKCKVGCEYCTSGCGRHATWTGKQWADEAVQHGATILDRTTVREIIHENSVAGGVVAIKGGTEYHINAKVVVCSAGGGGTAPILKRSGLWEAGSWFAGDPAFFAFGFVKDGPGNGGEHNMTVGWHDDEHEICFMAMQSPPIAWVSQALGDEPLKAVRYLHRGRKVLSVFAKISDEDKGKVFLSGKLSKTITEKDTLRAEYAKVVLRRILIKAGCDPNDIHFSGNVMGHPSQTTRVGKMLDTNLQTEIKNLYCCDTSVFPEAPGQPPALTVVCLAKRLARHLNGIV